jgi:hypothetical protein
MLMGFSSKVRLPSRSCSRRRPHPRVLGGPLARRSPWLVGQDVLDFQIGEWLQAARHLQPAERHLDVLRQPRQQVARAVLLHRIQREALEGIGQLLRLARHVLLEAVGDESVELNLLLHRISRLRNRAQLVGPLREAALQILGRRLGEDVVEEEALQLRHEVVEQRLGEIRRRQQQDVVQAESATGQPLEAVHRQTGLAVVAQPVGKGQVVLDVADHLAHELEGLACVVAQRRVVLGDEPVVDFVLAHHRIAALVLDDVVGHQEVAQEAQRLFLLLLQRLGDLLPLVLELGELRLLDLREQQVLEQVHRVQAHAALVDGLENLQRAAHVGGDLDEHHVVGQIAPILLQLGVSS